MLCEFHIHDFALSINWTNFRSDLCRLAGDSPNILLEGEEEEEDDGDDNDDDNDDDAAPG